MSDDLDLEDFLRGDLHADPDASLQAVLRGILVRSQFVPAVRHALGWRGLKQSPSADAWTTKIRGSAGVFGIVYLGATPVEGWTAGRYGLCYFPEPQEPMVERFSVRAAALAQQPDYHENIRAFPRNPEMVTLFGVGPLGLAVRHDRRALALCFDAASAHRTIAKDGVRLPRDGRPVQLIEPGGRDQDLPAFEIASALFEVLAASATFNLMRPPGCLIERRYPARETVYDRSGRGMQQEAPDLQTVHLLLGYGEADFESLPPFGSDAQGAPISLAAAESPDSAPPAWRDRSWWHAHGITSSTRADTCVSGVDVRPPLIVLTGFLGAGKTSFLQHFIEHQTQRHRFVAVIQNEIGAVGLDGKLVDYTVTEIDEGCVCCGLSGNLKAAIQGIRANFSPDYVILETSGLANPMNMLDDMAELNEFVRFDSTVTVVDAANLEEALVRSPIAADQIRAADVVVLNKRDLVDEAQLSAAGRRVRAINPTAPQFCTMDGDLNPAYVFDLDDRPGTGPAGNAAHTHSTHVTSGLWSRTVPLAPLDRRAFLEAVAALPPSVFRVKGLVEFTGSDQPMLFQYVAGRYELSAFPRTGVMERFLTVIGQGGDPVDAASLLGVATRGLEGCRSDL